MYLIRRVWKVKPGTSRKAAELISKMGHLYEKSGQRSATRVYVSGSTVPGPANTVYMDWTEETLQSPYRENNDIPTEMATLGTELRKLQEESHIEFYEMYVS